ncbi:MAG: SBBP repeat-containing protein [Candidatus Aminicenantes bacterium]|nr:SBBP repeat-containing protein [Candidatus Aminicenantes bacterium]
MKKSVRFLLAFSILVLFGFLLNTTVTQPKNAAATPPQILATLSHMPLHFVENKGQVSGEARFHLKRGEMNLFLAPDGMIYQILHDLDPEPADSKKAGEPKHRVSPVRVENIRTRFLGANPDVRLNGHNETGAVMNFLNRGSAADPVQSITARTFDEVLYSGLYPHVDLRVYGQEGALKYDYIIRPSGRVKDILIQYEGTTAVRLNDRGHLQIETSGGVLEDRKPLAFQIVNGKKVEIPAAYVMTEDNTVGLQVEGYDRSLDLTIDPELIYSTFLGDVAADTGLSIAIDKNGNAFITGATYSTNFPTTSGAYDTSFNGQHDAFVTKLNPTGTALVYSTFFGGSSYDQGNSIAVDGDGNVFVAGYTYSSDFPTTAGAYDSTHNGGYDAFVAKINSQGSNLLYSTVLGGSGNDVANAVAIDLLGGAYVTGYTGSANFPTTSGAFDTSLNGDYDGFVAKLNSTGTGLGFSTFLGGTWEDSSNAIAVSKNGNIFVTGYSQSTDFPTTTGAYQTTNKGYYDVFVSCLNSTGTGLLYSTYIGGAGEDRGKGIAVDASENVYITGNTGSTAYPTTTNAYDTTISGSYDAFITKLNSSGSALVYSTYLGGTNTEYATGIVIDSSGNAYIAGYTNSTNFPTVTGAFDTTHNGDYDAFLTRLDATGSSLVYSTYLGDSATDKAYALAVDSSTTVYLVGETFSRTFPVTSGAYDVSQNGNADVFVTRIATNLQTPFIALSTQTLIFGATTAGVKTSSQSFRVTNSGGGALNWSLATNQTWLSCLPVSGSGNTSIAASVNPTGLAAGSYTATITVSSTNAPNSPKTINVFLTVYNPTATTVPYGSFDSPLDQTTGVTGAIPVTGWVVDDIEVTTLEIKRDPHSSDPTGAIGPDGLVFIGYGLFVEGARPDIEQLYPAYPFANRAGWGYMMLTNFLPNHGNGQFKLYAYAIDGEGNKILLGSKTITCDNAHAVKPFGTIDTPIQGGQASGGSFVNFGWVLTPLPNTVPIDGSTIRLWIDGNQIGQPVYNQYRPDIAANFPGLNNSNGAVGYYYLDTTKYENKVHIMAWTAEDNVGNADGIGSRYFSILNGAVTGNGEAHPQSRQVPPAEIKADLGGMAVAWEPVMAKRGFSLSARPEIVLADADGIVRIEMPEVDRLEIGPGQGSYFSRGFLSVGGDLRPLPIGATLNSASGTFSWMPGPGFLGVYDLLFVKTGSRDGSPSLLRVQVKIIPKPGKKAEIAPKGREIGRISK